MSFPEVGIKMSRTIGHRDLLPEPAAGRFAAVANNERDYSACAAAKRDPNPSFAALHENERPEFIEFQLAAVSSPGSGAIRVSLKVGSAASFSAPVTDGLRETPITRSRPRMELHSPYGLRIRSFSSSVYPFGRGLSRLPQTPQPARKQDSRSRGRARVQLAK
jgi:hypothetical protein